MMKEKEAYAKDQELEDAIGFISVRVMTANRLLTDSELVAMLKLKIDREHTEQVIERLKDQMKTLGESRAKLLEEFIATRETEGDG